MARRGLVTMHLAGAKGLADNLKALPLATQKNVVTRALKKVAQPMLADAQARASQIAKSGRNASKLVISTTLSRRQRRGAVKEKGARTVYVGVRPSPVAHLLEFGTGPRYTRSGAYRGQMRARPYMRPAFDANWRAALDDLGKILGAEIEKAAARLARKQRKGR